MILRVSLLVDYSTQSFLPQYRVMSGERNPLFLRPRFLYEVKLCFPAQKHLFRLPEYKRTEDGKGRGEQIEGERG